MSRPIARRPVLVVLQLTGGNDALNSIVPYGDPLYYDNRPVVRVAEQDVLPIDGRLGFASAMAELKALYDRGSVAVLNGVGYPNADYSHFRSRDIWYTCEPSGDVREGWLGKVVRALDPEGENILTAVNFGRRLPQALALDGVSVASLPVLDGPSPFAGPPGARGRRDAARALGAMYAEAEHDEGAFPPNAAPPSARTAGLLRSIARAGRDASRGAERLRGAVRRDGAAARYPATDLGRTLRAVAQVKCAGLGTRVFYVERGGFDTHANQMRVQHRLWREVAAAVGAFFEDLEARGASDDVIMLVWSEFGRRVRDNGSGTDHGAAGVAFAVGARVKGGLYGECPSLRARELDDGSLRHAVDFRSVYATVLEDWLGLEAESIVNGSFARLGFV
jgi:uncharacterized protein (DUF1501 family)